jgi:muramoyltetrapeptide carboxypeptidase
VPTPLIKPRSLHKNDTIGIIAPASPISRDLLQAGVAAIEQLGYGVAFSDSIYAEELYFAGPHRQRARELERMFADQEIKGIICARGGYGTNHLLREIDVSIIKKNPKIFCGYSDVTTLLTYFHDSTGFVTFHGPMVTKDFAKSGGVDLESFRAILQGEECSFDTAGMQVIREGNAEGRLYGGCLSMLAASLGTPYEIQTEGTLLFIEDIATKPFQIDRMLTQLMLAGKFDGVQGVVFGEMLDCIQPGGQSYTLQEVISRTLESLKLPIVFGLRSGHVSQGNITVPLGVRARLSATAAEVELQTLEPATEG